ncbi:MAG: zinc-ribbon domain-containing protein [bacterium]
MKCTHCNAAIPGSAKFCPECGIHLDRETHCSACGKNLKPKAKFCHSCGKPFEEAPKISTTSSPIPRTQKNWLTTAGPFLFIPIFAIIIILLFWKNRDPEPLSSSSSDRQQQASQQQPLDMATMNKVHEMLERLQTNLEKNPKDLVSMDSLAIMYSIAGSFDKASEYYERHLEIEPDNKEVKIVLGMTYHNLKRSDEGLAMIQEVLKQEPNHAFALFYAGDIYIAKKEVELAAEQWNKIVSNYPNTEIANMAQQRIHEFVHEHSE